MRLWLFFFLYLANHFHYALLNSIDPELPAAAETELLPKETQPIIDEGGLDPKLIKTDPQPPTALESAIHSVLLPGPQIVTEVKDGTTDQDETDGSDAEDVMEDEETTDDEQDQGNSADEETPAESKADEDKADATDDGHVPLKEEGERMMTGNEEWLTDDAEKQEAVTNLPTSMSSAGYNKYEDEEAENVDEYDNGDDDDDHFQANDEDNYDDYYDYEEENEYVDDEDDKDIDGGRWLEDEYEEDKADDDYEYDDDENISKQEEATTDTWERTNWLGLSTTTKFDDYEDDAAGVSSSEEDIKVDAGKDLMESGHHFDSNIGMFAGTKVSTHSGSIFEMNKTAMYTWVLSVTLFLVLLLLFIFWNRQTIQRYIVSIRHPATRTGAGPIKKKGEDEQNLLKHEFV